MKPIVEAFRAIGRDVNKRQDSVYYGLMVIGASLLVAHGHGDICPKVLPLAVGLKELGREFFWRSPRLRRRLVGEKFTPLDHKKNAAAAAVGGFGAFTFACAAFSVSTDPAVQIMYSVLTAACAANIARGYQQLSSRGASLLELPKIYIDMWDYDGEDGPTRYERLKGALTKTMREMSAGFARPVPIRVRSNNAALLLPKAP